MQRLSVVILFGALACSASTLVDPFNAPQNNCQESQSYPYSKCDVIGDPTMFDIQKLDVSLSGGMLSATLYFNIGGVSNNGGALSLGYFNVGSVQLMPGDLFFYSPDAVYDPATPQVTIQNLRYGIPLVSRGSFVAGNLYQISSAVGVYVETALSALHDNSDFYRRSDPVLMTGSPATVTANVVTGDGVSLNRNLVANVPTDGTTNGALYQVSISVPVSSDFMKLVVNGEVGILFSSADCGNDVLQGLAFVSTPEPPPSLLLAAGLLLIIAGAWRRRAKVR